MTAAPQGGAVPAAYVLYLSGPTTPPRRTKQELDSSRAARSTYQLPQYELKCFHTFVVSWMKSMFQRVAIANRLNDPSLARWIPVEDCLPCERPSQFRLLESLGAAN